MAEKLNNILTGIIFIFFILSLFFKSARLILFIPILIALIISFLENKSILELFGIKKGYIDFIEFRSTIIKEKVRDSKKLYNYISLLQGIYIIIAMFLMMIILITGLLGLIAFIKLYPSNLFLAIDFGLIIIFMLIFYIKELKVSFFLVYPIYYLNPYFLEHICESESESEFENRLRDYFNYLELILFINGFKDTQDRNFKVFYYYYYNLFYSTNLDYKLKKQIFEDIIQQLKKLGDDRIIYILYKSNNFIKKSDPLSHSLFVERISKQFNLSKFSVFELESKVNQLNVNFWRKLNKLVNEHPKFIFWIIIIFIFIIFGVITKDNIAPLAKTIADILLKFFV